MFKKIIFLLAILILVSCGVTKATPVVRTTNSKKQDQELKNKVSGAKPVKKAGAKKPVIQTKKTSVANHTSLPKKEIPSVNQPKNNDKETLQSSIETKNNDSNTISMPVNEQQEVLQATTKVKVTSEIVLEYIDNFKATAKCNMLTYGIPSSIILAQGILESGAGTGPLSVQANNHFGIKCHKEWEGESINHDDDKEKECFRKYTQASESYKDHSLFLTSRSRYAFLFKLEKNDYKSWAKGLREAGYATDVNYPSKLITLIEKYELYRYDNEVLGIKNIERPPVIDTIISPAKEKIVTHQVAKGDTLYSISKRYNIAIEDLRKQNSISNNSISIGQILIIR